MLGDKDGGREGWERGVPKRLFGGDACVHYLHFGDGFMVIRVESYIVQLKFVQFSLYQLCLNKAAIKGVFVFILNIF